MFRKCIIVSVLICFCCILPVCAEKQEKLFIQGVSENVNLYDYEQFLENIDEIDKKIHATPHKKEFITGLYDNKIDVGIEINNYFDNEKPVPIDLKECLCIALEKNFDIKILKERSQVQKYNYKNAQVGYLPTLNYNYNFYNLSGAFLAGGVIPTIVNETPFTSTWSINFPVFQGTRRLYEIRSRKKLYHSSKRDIEFTKDEVLKNTVVSYYRTLGYKLGIEVLTRNLIESQAQLDINKENVNAGVGTKFDVTRAEAEVAKASQQLSQAYNDYRLEQAKLANILGINVSSSLFPKDNEVQKIQLVKSNLNLMELTEISNRTRPDLQALKLKIEALENEKKMVYSGFTPTLDLYGNIGSVGTQRIGSYESKRIGLLVNWNLGNNLGMNEYTLSKRYDAQLAEANYELEKKQRDIEQSLISSYYNIKTAEDLVEAAQKEVSAADESLRLAFLRLESGVGIYVDVLQAQSAKTNANINLITAIIKYNVAQVDLLFDTGLISVFNIIEPDTLIKDSGSKSNNSCPEVKNHS